MHGEDLMRGSKIREYIRAHVDSWYAFVDTLELIDELGGQDLLLVTGRSTTSKWSVAAFTQKKVECGIEFHVGFGGAGAHLALAGVWANASSVEHRSGPSRPAPPQSFMADSVQSAQPSGSTSSSLDTAVLPPSDQTVFLRGLCVRTRSFGVPPKIKAAAQPRDNNNGSSREESDSMSSPGASSLHGDQASDGSSITDYGEDSDMDEGHTMVCC